MVGSEETISLFPEIDTRGLKGAAVWNDATIVDQEKLMKGILELGGTVLESHEVEKLLVSEGKVEGVVANGTSYYSNVVINATGPWCRSFAKKMDQDIPQLFRPSLAFNLLFKRAALSSHAVAVTTPRRTYFIRPLNNQLFAGTYHLPWSGSIEDPTPPEEHIDLFIDDLNQAIPRLNLKREEIEAVRAGFLPVKREGSEVLATREMIIDHGRTGGPSGFYSVSGVKWTTARRVAERVLGKL